MSTNTAVSKKSSSSSPSLEREEVSKRRKVILPVSQQSVQIAGWLKSNALLLSTITAVLLGIAIGLPLRDVELSNTTKMYISFPGEVMMNMLKSAVIPLVAISLIANLSQFNMKQMGKIGGLAMGYYVVTTILAVILGIALVLAIHPGKAEDYGEATTRSLELSRSYKYASTVNTLLDLLRNMFPENMVQATVWSAQGDDDGQINWVRNSNILGVIVSSIFLGAVLASFPDAKKKPLVEILSVLDAMMMKAVMIMIWYSPVGILFLVLGKILTVKSLTGTMGLLGLYMVAVITGLVIHACITLPLIYLVCTRQNPLKFARGMSQALTMAFATASSAATLPISMKCLEDKLHIDPRIIRFVLPIGATINMDGTALYEAVASIFIAQMHGEFELTFSKVVVVSLTATLASIGAAAIPSAGIITMMIVLSAIGLPQEEVALIIAVDWLLDRFRTTVNVWGDAIGAGIVQKWLGSSLEKLDVVEEKKKKIFEEESPKR